MNMHPPIQNSPLQLLPPQNTTRPTQLPVQPVANPNHKTIQATNNVDLPTYPTNPTYLISTMPLQYVQLRSGRDLSQIKTPITIEEEPDTNEKMGDEATNENNVVALNEQNQKGQLEDNPTLPYPERLSLEKPIVPLEDNIETKLKNLCIKIPLVQAIRDIPIYVKIVRELCLNKVDRKKKDLPTIQFIGQFADQLTNQIQVDKYKDPRNPIVTISIKVTYIPNTLIDLGAAINVMTLKMMRELNILNIQPTLTMLELADR